MRELLHSAKYLAEDLASIILFAVVLTLTHQVMLAVGLGMTLGVGQIVWRLAGKAPIDAMQWLSLVLVVASGVASFVTNDPRFVMLKPTVIHAVIGAFMLKPGWMTRYLPPVAQELVPDIALAFGYVWSGLMFATGALNVALALTLDPTAWAQVMAAFSVASLIVLFLVQFGVMRLIGQRRYARAARPAA